MSDARAAQRSADLGRRAWLRSVSRVGLAAAAWPCAARAADVPLRIGSTGASAGTLTLALSALTQRGMRITPKVVSTLGCSGSLRAVEQKALDLALISRPLRVDERMRGLVAYEYGRTPFVLATSVEGVAGLTRKQLAEMIEKPTARWPDGTPVRLVLRPRSDGDSELLASMGAVIQIALDNALARKGMVMAITDNEAAAAITRLRGGLGTCSLALLRSGAYSLNPLALDGVAPTVANVNNASYRIVNRMHLATLGAPAGLANELISYLQSTEGLAMLDLLGHSTRFQR